MKDIFIDNSCASKHFSSPVDENYIELIKWIVKFEEGSENNAVLVISNKLLKEYYDSNRNASSPTSIPIIIAILTRQDRLNKKSNKELKDLTERIFSKKIQKKLRSNKKDWSHIALVLLSCRKMALTEDENLAYDLLNFPKSKNIVSNRPESLNYKE